MAERAQDLRTRLEALRYYRRVVDRFDLQIDFGEQVVNVASAPGMSRDVPGADTIFDVETRTEKGVRKIRQSRNVVFAIFQPSPRRPTRFASGTFTSVKNTSLNSACPVIVRSGRTSMPGVSIGISR